MGEVQSDHPVLIVGEAIDGVITPGSEDLAKRARELGAVFGGTPVGLLFGSNSEPATHRWAAVGGMTVNLLDPGNCRLPNPSMTVAGVEIFMETVNPLAICLPHTLRACQAAAMLAWRHKWPCVSAVESVAKTADGWVLRRPILGGRRYATISVHGHPMLLTAMPGIYSGVSSADPGQGGCVVHMQSPMHDDPRFRPMAIERQQAADQALEQARVVVAGGRGLKGSEQAALLTAVAGMFKSGAVAGSRGACDLGWLPHSRQIGETGRTVSPALYLACGISGAPQHLAGIRDAQTVVAVNRDPEAAILSRADYAVIEDLSVFLPRLRERYARRSRSDEGA